MACEVVAGSSGTSNVRVCHRGRGPGLPPCSRCGLIADRLCDFWTLESGTCDRPLCVRCSYRPILVNANYCEQHWALAALAQRPGRLEAEIN